MIRVRLDSSKYDSHREIYAWCEEQFQPKAVSYRRWSREIIFGSQHYKFQREQDAILFALRWS